MLYLVLHTPTSLPMMLWPGSQAFVVSRADKIVISALFASSFVRNNIFFEVGFTVGQDVGQGRKASQGKGGLDAILVIMIYNFKRLPTASVSTQSAFLLISSQKYHDRVCLEDHNKRKTGG